jgi:uncharacterized RDD family membrane protein YckC
MAIASIGAGREQENSGSLLFRRQVPEIHYEAMSATSALDLTATVTTPENIQFEYRIAGPFRRLPAFILDFIVRVGFFVSLAIVIVVTGVFSAIPFSVAMVVMSISYFLLDWFYGLFFETYWNGKTPGKWMTKVQVISADGRPISAYQATIRNFLRFADIGPFLSLELLAPEFPPMYAIPTGLVAFFCMACTSRFQRLGDLAAGTMVVVDERTWVPPTVKFEDPRVEALAQYIPPSFRMSRTLGRAIAMYAERRGRMPAGRRTELASILAKPLNEQFGFRADTSADLLICALYYREFILKPMDGREDRKGRAGLFVGSPAKSSLSSNVDAPPTLQTIEQELDGVVSSREGTT